MTRNQTIIAVIIAAMIITILPAITGNTISNVQAADGDAEVDVTGRIDAGIYSTQWQATNDLNALAAAVGKPNTFSGTFHNIYENEHLTNEAWSTTRDILEQVWQAHSTPFANVGIDKPSYRIARGDYDAQIRDWAYHVKRYTDMGEGRSVIIAPLQEMNYGPTPWGCDNKTYTDAYRKFVNIFREIGLDETKVRWAFAPNNYTSPQCGTMASFYPGDNYVDVMAISAYNWGTCAGGAWGRWDTPADIYARALDELRAINNTKPFIIAQTAAPQRGGCGGDGDQWVQDMFNYLAKDPNVAGLVWFNFNKETNWQIWNGTTVRQGWKNAIRDTATYQWPLTNWFNPGTLHITTPTDDGPGNNIIILGGTAAVSNQIAYDIRANIGGLPQRIAGTNRYSTAAAISKKYFKTADTIFIATGENFADALSAGAAAAEKNGPLLLTGQNTLAQETRNELTRLKPETIYIVGGTAAVSQNVQNQLQAYAPNVKRLAGTNRYSTAAAISTTIFPEGVDTIYLATGTSFADALSAGAAAAHVKGTVLLTDPNHLSPEIAAAIIKLEPTTIKLVGGPAALSTTIETELRALEIENIQRLWGTNRYTTSTAISQNAFKTETGQALLATGTSFPDALAGVAAAGQAGIPLLLTDPNRAPAPILKELDRLIP